ncbi:MAG: hypothetical protein HRT87_10740, partial [Legionellales bacterium]|nr:hypothetical protein [Legionellales bacterium]
MSRKDDYLKRKAEELKSAEILKDTIDQFTSKLQNNSITQDQYNEQFYLLIKQIICKCYTYDTYKKLEPSKFRRFLYDQLDSLSETNKNIHKNALQELQEQIKQDKFLKS